MSAAAQPYHHDRGWSFFYINQCTVWCVETNSLLLKMFTEMDHRGPTEQLTSLNISNNYIGSNGIPPLLEVLKTWVTLTTLNMSNNRIDSANCSLICEMAKKHPSLTSINLSRNPMFDSAGRFLLNMVRYNKNILELQLDQVDIKPTLLAKINAQVANNIARKEPPPPTPPPPLDLTILPALPPSPSPFEREGVDLFDATSTLLEGLYKIEVNPADGGTTFSPQHTKLLEALSQYGSIGAQLFADFGFTCIRLLDHCGYVLSKSAVQQEVNLLKKINADCVRENELLQTQLEVLEKVIIKNSRKEITTYLSHVRNKVRIWNSEAAANTVHLWKNTTAKQTSAHVQELLLQLLEQRRLIYVVDRIGYFDPQIGKYISCEMNVGNDGLTQRGVGPLDWDWYDLVDFWTTRDTTAPREMVLERAEVLKEVLSLVPSCVIDFVVYCVLVDLNEKGSDALQYLHRDPAAQRQTTPLPPLDIKMPLQPHFSLHAEPSFLKASMDTQSQSISPVPSVAEGVSVSPTPSTLNNTTNANKGKDEIVWAPQYGGDVLDVVCRWWGSAEMVRAFSEQFYLWLSQQAVDYLENAASECGGGDKKPE